MRYGKKMNRYERQAFQREKLVRDLHGAGLYVYRNNTSGDLMLPKPAEGGVRHVGKMQEFRGDNYFMDMVRRHELVLVTEVEAPQVKEVTMQQTLILDQPETFTNQGKVEHVAAPTKGALGKKPVQPVKESPVPEEGDTLLVEDPMSGIDILVD